MHRNCEGKKSFPSKQQNGVRTVPAAQPQNEEIKNNKNLTLIDNHTHISWLSSYILR